MASLWKHPNSRYWTACFTARDGRQLKRTTKTTDRRLAQKLADDFENAARIHRTARQAREVIADIHQHITGEALPTKTTREYVEEWLARKAPETASATMKFYRYCTAKFLKWLRGDADKDMALITREHITRFRNEESTSLAPKTVNHDLKCIRMVFRAAKRDGLLAEDPAEFVDTVRARTSESDAKRRAFTVDELKTVLDSCDSEWRSMVFFGLYTGQRLGDIARLTWAQVDTTAKIIRITTAKTSRRMQIPIAAPLMRHIETLSAPDGRPEDCPIHPRLSAIEEKNGTGHLSGAFGDILASAGLRMKQPHRASSQPRAFNPLSFHSLRYTATTMLHAAGVASGIAQEFIGHDSEAIHQHYAKFGIESLTRAAKKLPDIGSKKRTLRRGQALSR